MTLTTLWRRIVGADNEVAIESIADDGTFYDVTITVPKGQVANMLWIIRQIAAEDAALLASGVPEHLLAQEREARRAGL